MTAPAQESLVSILVPVFNQVDLTRRCFESIRRFVTVPSEIIFIDNGSTDSTAKWLKKCQDLNGTERVKVISNETNKGFACAINQAAAIARGDLLIFNNDCEFVRPGSVRALRETLYSDPSIGAVGPTTDFCLGPQMIEDNVKYPPLHQVRFLIGFCMLVKREAWEKVGGMCEEYPKTGEDDLDLSLRLQKDGYSLACDRRVFVHHLGGATQGEIFDRYGEKYRQAQQAGREKLIRNWGEGAVKALFEPVDFSTKKVMVAIPTYTSVQPEAYANHVGVFSDEARVGERTGLKLIFRPLLRSAICNARNELARWAVDQGCTHLMFIDDDMMVPPYSIHRLLERQLPIVSGLCHLRTPPFFPSMFLKSPTGTDGRIYYISRWPKDQVIQVDAVGMACCLIETEVFKKIKDLEVPGTPIECPECHHGFHEPPIKPKGSTVSFLYGRSRPGENTVGEDVYFCDLARQAGFKIMVDTSVKFGHLGMPTVYNEEYFENVRSQHQLPGVEYTTYEDTRSLIREPRRGDGALATPADVAAHGLEGEASEAAERIYTGAVGDGKDPGDKKAHINVC